MKEDHILLQKNCDKVPSSIFPQPGDTKESVLRGNEINTWLDDVRKYGIHGTVNGDPSNHTPMRRSCALTDALLSAPALWKEEKVQLNVQREAKLEKQQLLQEKKMLTLPLKNQKA
jgi:hypothetical protein